MNPGRGRVKGLAVKEIQRKARRGPNVKTDGELISSLAGQKVIGYGKTGNLDKIVVVGEGSEQALSDQEVNVAIGDVGIGSEKKRYAENLEAMGEGAGIDDLGAGGRVWNLDTPGKRFIRRKLRILFNG